MANRSATARPTGPDADQQQVDYFVGFEETLQFFFPDGITFIEYNKMNEGQKKRYQEKTSRDVVLKRGSGDAHMRMDPGSERWELIQTCAVNWNLRRGEHLAPFSKPNLLDFLNLADPRLVEDLEKAIRKANPWLMDEMKSEDIQREIDNLEEMLKVAKERESGEVSSSSR